MKSYRHLSAFQRDLLYIVSELEVSYGLGIKRALGEYYGDTVNAGRVYQNLGSLIEEGYLKKSAIDDRTNSYTLTRDAVLAIEDRHHWQQTRSGGRFGTDLPAGLGD